MTGARQDDLDGPADAQSCAECKRQGTDEDERWWALLLIDDGVGLFCPECAAQEFGP